MTPRDLGNIHTIGNSCIRDVALKLSRHFYLLMEKPYGRYFQVRSPYFQVAQCNQKTPILVSSRWQIKSEKVKKRISINILVIPAITFFKLWAFLEANFKFFVFSFKLPFRTGTTLEGFLVLHSGTNVPWCYKFASLCYNLQNLEYIACLVALFWQIIQAN